MMESLCIRSWLKLECHIAYSFWPFLLCCFIRVLDFIMLRERTTISMSIYVHFRSRSRIWSPVTVIRVHYIDWQYLFIHLFIQTFIYLRNIYWAQTISLTLLINIGGGQVGKSKVSPMLEKWTSKPRGMSWAGRLGSTKGWSFDAARSWCDWLYFLLNSSTRGSWSKVDFYRNNPDVHQLVHGETKRGLSYRDCYVWSCRGMKWRYVLSHGSCSVGEGSYETARFVRFHSFEMSRAGGSVETGSRATVA